MSQVPGAETERELNEGEVVLAEQRAYEAE